MVAILKFCFYLISWQCHCQCHFFQITSCSIEDLFAYMTSETSNLHHLVVSLFGPFGGVTNISSSFCSSKVVDLGQSFRMRHLRVSGRPFLSTYGLCSDGILYVTYIILYVILYMIICNVHFLRSFLFSIHCEMGVDASLTYTYHSV